MVTRPSRRRPGLSETQESPSRHHPLIQRSAVHTLRNGRNRRANPLQISGRELYRSGSNSAKLHASQFLAKPILDKPPAHPIHLHPTTQMPGQQTYTEVAAGSSPASPTSLINASELPLRFGSAQFSFAIHWQRAWGCEIPPDQRVAQFGTETVVQSPSSRRSSGRGVALKVSRVRAGDAGKPAGLDKKCPRQLRRAILQIPHGRSAGS